MIGTMSKRLRFDIKDRYVSLRFKIHFTLQLIIRGDQEDPSPYNAISHFVHTIAHYIHIVSIRSLSYNNLNY